MEKMDEEELREFWDYIRTYYLIARKQNKHTEKSLKSKSRVKKDTQ